MTAEQGRVAARVPAQLLRGRTRVLRPVDAVGVYAHPRPEFARLEQAGALHRVAPGYNAAVPDDRVGLVWLPELEAVALGVGVALAGVDGAVLMGLSAARVHGGLPRAIGVAVVAMARHRPVLRPVWRHGRWNCGNWYSGTPMRHRHGCGFPTAGAFVAWKTIAWLDRAASRDLYDLWALAQIGAIGHLLNINSSVHSVRQRGVVISRVKFSLASPPRKPSNRSD